MILLYDFNHAVKKIIITVKKNKTSENIGTFWIRFKKSISNLFVKSANWIYSLYLYVHIKKKAQIQDAESREEKTNMQFTKGSSLKLKFGFIRFTTLQLLQ